MRIKKFSVINFKSIGENKLSFDFSENIIVLIGENNVGKSIYTYNVRWSYAASHWSFPKIRYAPNTGSNRLYDPKKLSGHKLPSVTASLKIL